MSGGSHSYDVVVVGSSNLDLVATGGSDCHGMAKGQPLIGRVKLPYPQVEALRSRRSRHGS